MNYLVFDIGGTNARFVFFKDSKELEKGCEKTIKDRRLYDFLEGVVRKIMQKYKIKKFDGIAVSSPGALSSEKLILTKPTNIPRIKNLHLSQLKKFTKKLVLENDANCAALGAFKLEGRSVKDLVCFTLGTGLGCGIIIQGMLYKGKGKASEFGHTTIDLNGRKCPCGNFGCLENYVSTRGLLSIAKKNGLNVDCYELGRLARKRNKKALKTYREFGRNVSLALVNIANALDPELIVLTGGLCNSSEFFISEAKKHAEKRYFSGINPKIKFHKQNLSLIGALELIKK